MSRKSALRGSDVRGVGRLAIDATLGLTSLVETMHHNILRTPGIFGKSTQAPARGITGFVYKSIRGVTRLVGRGIDVLLGQLSSLIDGGASSPEREAVLAALNGVLGDHLAASGNPLAIPMRMRRAGESLTLARPALSAAIPAPTGKILLLVHGLCMSDLQWRRHGHDHGAALAVDTGFTPLYLHYNSGLHISTNGHELAQLIETLLQAWPTAVDEFVILAHSMGGLLTRSACASAEQAGYAWPARLNKIIFLGTPHHGAPLERGGNWVDAILDASPYTTAFARLGKIRSAGITDLRYGNLCDADWQHGDRFVRSRRKPKVLPLPEGVACHAIAATLGKRAGKLNEALLGDGLVPLGSALGYSALPRRNLHIPQTRRWIGRGMNHLDLLDNKDVYARIRRWLS